MGVIEAVSFMMTELEKCDDFYFKHTVLEQLQYIGKKDQELLKIFTNIKRKLILYYHPDKNKELTVAESTVMMTNIEAAYTIIKNYPDSLTEILNDTLSLSSERENITLEYVFNSILSRFILKYMYIIMLEFTKKNENYILNYNQILSKTAHQLKIHVDRFPSFNTISFDNLKAIYDKGKQFTVEIDVEKLLLSEGESIDYLLTMTYPLVCPVCNSQLLNLQSSTQHCNHCQSKKYTSENVVLSIVKKTLFQGESNYYLYTESNIKVKPRFDDNKVFDYYMNEATSYNSVKNNIIPVLIKSDEQTITEACQTAIDLNSVLSKNISAHAINNQQIKSDKTYDEIFNSENISSFTYVDGKFVYGDGSQFKFIRNYVQALEYFFITYKYYYRKISTLTTSSVKPYLLDDDLIPYKNIIAISPIFYNYNTDDYKIFYENNGTQEKTDLTFVSISNSIKFVELADGECHLTIPHLLYKNRSTKFKFSSSIKKHFIMNKDETEAFVTIALTSFAGAIDFKKTSLLKNAKVAIRIKIERK